MDAKKDDKPGGVSRTRRNIGALVLFAIFVIFVYNFALNRDQRDAVNAVASVTGVKVVPWIERAQTATRMTLQGPSGPILAKAVQRYTHPSGKSPKLDGFNVRAVGDTLVTEATVSWKGGILGNSYITKVQWKVTESQFLGMQILEDTAMTSIASSNEMELEKYLRTEIYPVILANAGG